MVEYNKVNSKLADSKLNKLNSALKNQIGVTLRMNIKIFHGNNLPHELLLTTRWKNRLRNAFENNMPTDIKLSRAQIPKIIHSGRILGSWLRKLAGAPMKLAVALAKNILDPLGVTAVASAIDAGIPKNNNTWKATLIISNEEMDDILMIVQTLEDSNILLKGVTKTIENETKEQKGGFLGMLLGTLGASLLGNMLTEIKKGRECWELFIDLRLKEKKF